MVDVSLSFDILNAVVNILIALVLTIWWQNHLHCKRERDEQLKDLDELYHAWKEVEPHMISLDRLVNHGVAYKLVQADLKTMMQNCFAAC